MSKGTKRIFKSITLFVFAAYLLSGCAATKDTEEIVQEETSPIETDSVTEPEVSDQADLVADQTEEPLEITEPTLIDPKGQTIKERFLVPLGFERMESEPASFGEYLQNLPLKPDGTKVSYFDGRQKLTDVYMGVVDFTLGDKDLQQCADAIMRLRAEYLYENERFDEIAFHFVSGFHAEFSKWAAGNGIAVDGNNVTWITNSANNNTYESFQKYLDVVYTYASTLSLEKELVEKPISDLSIGDVFIQGGSPGHCVIVVDAAINNQSGEKIFILAQSYMPAQDIQILKSDAEDSPWNSANLEEKLYTREWTFEVSDLKTWK